MLGKQSSTSGVVKRCQSVYLERTVLEEDRDWPRSFPASSLTFVIIDAAVAAD